MEGMNRFGESGDENIEPQPYPSTEGIEVEEMDVEDITLEGSAAERGEEDSERTE